jgi:hypothetical protein
VWPSIAASGFSRLAAISRERGSAGSTLDVAAPDATIIRGIIDAN